jgi:hypothetical protein
MYSAWMLIAQKAILEPEVVGQLTTSVGVSLIPAGFPDFWKGNHLQIQAVSLAPTDAPAQSAHHADLAANANSPIFNQDVSMDNDDVEASHMNLAKGNY